MAITLEKPLNLKRVLLSEALGKVWANPKADKAGIFKTNRITSVTGAIGFVNLIISSLPLPIPNRRYIVVELGNVFTSLVGLGAINKNVWYDIATLINTLNITMLGFCQGRVVNEAGCYVYISHNNNVIIAIDYANNASIVRLDSPIYYKFYTNLAFSGLLPPSDISMETGQLRVAAVYDGNYVSFINLLTAKEAEIGVAPLIFVNGLYRPDGVNDTTIQSGDVIQYLFDPYIVSRHDEELLTLDGFESSLDEMNKHILSTDGPSDIYVDDVEIYISGLNAQMERVGVYYPRLTPSDIRMLTYKDWSISSSTLSNRLLVLEQMYDVHATLSQIQIHVFKRNNGQFRNVVLDNDHIADLMNLPIEQRRMALSGVQATLDIWNAVNLERSQFLMFIAKELSTLNFDSMDNVLSRSGVVDLLDSVFWDQKLATWCLPISAGEKGGQLIRFNPNGYNPTKTVYQQVNRRKEPYSNGVGYEMFFPDFDLTAPLDVVIPVGAAGVSLVESGYGVFCYYMSGDVLEVARRGIDYFVTVQTENTRITWSTEMLGYERYIRTADKTVIFSVVVNRNNLNDGFDIYGGREYAHNVGMGCAMVWCNGRYLVEGLDYTVSNGKVFVVSKTSYLTLNQTFFVIYTGLPQTSLIHEPLNRWGWVEHGKLLNNVFYDFLMYRNYQIFVNGNAMSRGSLIPQEEYEDYPNGNVATLVDGTPFAVVNKPFILDDVALGDAINLLSQQEVIDQQITDYLGIIFPQAPSEELIVIPQKYELVSPLMDKVIEAIDNEELVIGDDYFDNSEIYNKVELYIHLLDSDPCLRDHDSNYVVISPRWAVNTVIVTPNEYTFINQVNTVLLFGRVQGLNQFVTIE